MKLKIIFSFLILSISILPLYSQKFKDKASGIALDTPKGWTVNATETSLDVKSPDATVNITFNVLSEGDFEKAITDTEEAMKSMMTDIQENEPKSTKINGMEAVSISGTGQKDGVVIQWDVSILIAKKPVFILSILNPGWEKHKNALADFSKSIKRIK